MICIAVFTLMIFLPPLIYDYTYPNNGDDAAYHLLYFESLKNGAHQESMYLGQTLVGYPIVALNKLFGISIDSLYLWFNFLVLWLVGVSTYLFVKKITSSTAGLYAMFLVIFPSSVVLNLFDTGAIFDLLTVGVLLPFGLFCYLSIGKRFIRIICFALILILLVGIHSIGIVRVTTIMQPATPISAFASQFLNYQFIILFGVTIVGLILQRTPIDKKCKLLVTIFLLIIAIFSIFAFTNLSYWATRFATDMAIVVVLLEAVLFGIFIANDHPRNIIKISLVAILVIVSLPNCFLYYRYNSAVKQVDKEAIAYINSIPGDYYSCSPEVAYWIYDRFVDKSYKEGSLPYISRSEPMSSKTSPYTVDYWMNGKTIIVPESHNYKLFSKGGIEVNVAH